MDRFSAIVAASILALANPAQSDVVRLHDGGEVRGTIVSRSHAESIRVETLDGIVVEVSSADVSAVIPRPLVAEEYVEKARQLDDTAEAHWQLAEWCAANRLTSQRKEQLRAVLKVTPDDEKARKLLGYVLRDGKWLTADDAKRAEGLVKYGRRWVTPAEAALMTEIDENSKRAKQWFPKAVDLAKQLESSEVHERFAALEAIGAVDNPDALAAWVRTFSDHPLADARLVYVSAIGDMGVVPAIRPLTKAAVEDPDPRVRKVATSRLPIKHGQLVVEALAKWLTHENNTFVQRSALAIGTVKHDAAVPQLIRALVTGHWQTQRWIERTPLVMPTGSVFGGTPAPTFTPEVETGLLTGQYPVTPVQPTGRVRTRRVRVEIRNETVLGALVTITGENFGYDERRWYSWWRRTKS